MKQYECSSTQKQLKAWLTHSREYHAAINNSSGKFNGLKNTHDIILGGGKKLVGKKFYSKSMGKENVCVCTHTHTYIARHTHTVRTKSL